MRIERIYTGNWFPRTEMHLKEYYKFLTQGTSLLPIDAKALTHARKNLHLGEVKYVGLASEGRFDHVNAVVENIDTVFYEDGLLIAKSDIKSFAKDFHRLHEIYDKRISPALSLVFSVGLPAIKHNDLSFADRVTVIVATEATPKEIDTLAAKHKDKIHFTAHHSAHQVYLGAHLIFIISKESDAPITERLVRSLIFFREFEKHMGHFLNLHRSVWQSVEEIRNKQSLALKELPVYRDMLLDYDRDLSIVVARLGQMEYFLDERKLEIDEFGHAAYFRALEAYRFGKMHTNVKYLEELWSQLHEYLRSSADIIGFMYQDNLQKSMDVLQFIFLIGAIAGVFYLGNLGGTTMYLSDSTGNPLAKGVMEGFDLQTLLIFGGFSILFSIIFFLGARLFMSTLKRVKTSSILGQRKPFVPKEKH